MKYLLTILGGLIGVVIFVLIAQTSQNYSYVLNDITQQVGIVGVVSYIGVTILAIVVAPLGTGFLLPVAANSFGPFLAATYSIIGWMIGSIIAFAVSRRYGQKYVQNVKLVQNLHTFEKTLSPKYFVVLLVILRMLLPVDLMSYALGLGSSVRYSVFMVTTLAGISPFAFLFAYAAVSSVSIQVVVSTLGTFAFLFGAYVLQHQYKETKKEIKDTIHI